MVPQAVDVRARHCSLYTGTHYNGVDTCALHFFFRFLGPRTPLVLNSDVVVRPKGWPATSPGMLTDVQPPRKRRSVEPGTRQPSANVNPLPWASSDRSKIRPILQVQAPIESMTPSDAQNDFHTQVSCLSSRTLASGNRKKIGGRAPPAFFLFLCFSSIPFFYEK